MWPLEDYEEISGMPSDGQLCEECKIKRLITTPISNISP
jgi:hypothetical protein